LPAYRVNEQYRFNRAELLEWATSRKINVSVEIFHEPESHAAALPGLVDTLEAGGIFYRLGGKDKESVLRAVVETMRLPEAVDREFLFRVLLAREALGSTGIGDGIAIPHVRSPMVLHVPRPLVTLCFLERPVDFGALDRKPVHVLFSLISPTVHTHLQLLSRLSYALHDVKFKDVVTRQGPREQILDEARRVEANLQTPAGAAGGAGM
jgi:nitrogen PTS system EIIA component